MYYWEQIYYFLAKKYLIIGKAIIFWVSGLVPLFTRFWAFWEHKRSCSSLTGRCFFYTMSIRTTRGTTPYIPMIKHYNYISPKIAQPHIRVNQEKI